MAELSPAQRIDWLRLARTEQVGPVTFHRLIERFGDAAAAINALPEMAKRGGLRDGMKVASTASAERELAAVERLGGRLVLRCEPAYPPLLAEIDDAPPVLTLFGDAALLLRPCIAVVGARNASIAGRKLARDLAAELGGAGLVVVSGLARGIDSAAHQGALATGTIAVMAGGADVVYPPENESLHRDIAERGVVVAELSVGTRPTARHFPRRNRIVSGLSRATIVVEAALRSGSLTTARFALEQGREVMAVPGSPADPRVRGSNRLIKEGAVLVEEAADVLAALGPFSVGSNSGVTSDGGSPVAGPGPSARTRPEEPPEGTVERLLTCLSAAPLPVDELVRACQLSAAVVTAALLELELAGRIQRHPGGQISLI
jgi:DNA processing protein